MKDVLFMPDIIIIIIRLAAFLASSSTPVSEQLACKKTNTHCRTARKGIDIYKYINTAQFNKQKTIVDDS